MKPQRQNKIKRCQHIEKTPSGYEQCHVLTSRQTGNGGRVWWFCPAHQPGKAELTSTRKSATN